MNNSDRTQDPRCAFCDIVANRESNKIIFQNDRIVAFDAHDAHDAPDAPDASDASDASSHILVIPRSHIRNIHECGPRDASLVREMDSVGRWLLRRRNPGCEVKLGYHVPPFVSVDHLHLHAFALPHVPWWTGLLKYGLPCVWRPSHSVVTSLTSPGHRLPDSFRL